MEERSIPVGEFPHVILKVDGNVSLKGSDETEIAVNAKSPEDLTLEQQDDEVHIRCASDCAIRVPRQAVVDIVNVDGNLSARALDGELRIQSLDGNLDLRSVGPVQIEGVDGNLSVKTADGDFTIRTVGGNATVRNISGSFLVEGTIEGNLIVDDVSKDIVARSDGNLTLGFDPLTGQKYEFTADGNIFCRLPEDASAKIIVEKAGKIMVDLGDVHVVEKERLPFEIDLGEGDARLVFAADGNVQITGQAPDWGVGEFDFDFDLGGEFDDMADQIGRQVSEQIDAQVNMIEQQINVQMENLNAHLGNIGLSPEQAERIAARAREASARATARAQERMQQAQERIQRKMEVAQRKAEQKARSAERAAQRSAQREKRSWSFVWPAPPVPPVPPARPGRPPAPEAAGEPVSDEERLLILRMLQEKKISAEEAEQLLSALEGKGA